MKRSYALLLALVMALSLAAAFPVLAEDAYYPGDACSVSMTITPNIGQPVTAFKIKVRWPGEILELISMSLTGKDGEGVSGAISGAVNPDETLFAGEGFSTEERFVFTVRLRVKPIDKDYKPFIVLKQAFIKFDGGWVSASPDRAIGVILKAFTWSEWEVTTPASCLEDGVETRTNNRGGTQTRPIAALGHTWGPWELAAEPTCQSVGYRVRYCNRGVHEEKQVFLAVSHKAGPWEVVKLPTKRAEGLEEKHCVWCNVLMENRAIPKLPITYYPANTASSQGLQFRNENPELTKKWYMFTPVDLSADGQQVIPIIASNIYKVGSITLKVADGAVTASNKFLKPIKPRSSFLTYFGNLGEVSRVEPEDLADVALPFDEPVSIADQLQGDTRVLLYTHFVIDYHDDIDGLRHYGGNSKAFKALTLQLRSLMD